MIKEATTLCALLAALTLEGCSTLNYFTRLVDSQTQTEKERPEKPTINSYGPNILEILTNGYDINLKPYLRHNRRTIVVLGTYWCKPCEFIDWKIKRNGGKYPLDFIMVDLAYRDEDGDDINSPAAYRYRDEYGVKGWPFFLVFDGKTLRGTIQFDPRNRETTFDDLDKLVGKAQTFR